MLRSQRTALRRIASRDLTLSERASRIERIEVAEIGRMETESKIARLEMARKQARKMVQKMEIATHRTDLHATTAIETATERVVARIASATIISQANDAMITAIEARTEVKTAKMVGVLKVDRIVQSHRTPISQRLSRQINAVVFIHNVAVSPTLGWVCGA